MVPLQRCAICCRAVRNHLRRPAVPEGRLGAAGVAGPTGVTTPQRCRRRRTSITATTEWSGRRRLASSSWEEEEEGQRRSLDRRRLGAALGSAVHGRRAAGLPPWAVVVSAGATEENWGWEAPNSGGGGVNAAAVVTAAEADAKVETTMAAACGMPKLHRPASSDRTQRSPGAGLPRENFSSIVNDQRVPFEHFVRRWTSDLDSWRAGELRLKSSVFREIKALLGRRNLSTHQLCSLVHALQQALTQADGRLVDVDVTIELHWTVVRALTASTVIDTNGVGIHLWKMVLEGLAVAAREKPAVGKAFRKLLCAMPASLLDQIVEPVARILLGYSKSISCQRPSGSEDHPNGPVLPCQQEAIYFANALQNYDRRTLDGILEVAMGFRSPETAPGPVGEIDLGPARSYQLWCLSIFARRKIFTFNQLVQTLERLFPPTDPLGQRLSAAEIGLLWAITATRKSTTSKLDEYLETGLDQDVALAQLAIIITSPGNLDTRLQLLLLQHLCRALEAYGHLECWVTAFSALCGRQQEQQQQQQQQQQMQLPQPESTNTTTTLTRIHARAMALVAVACGDYRLAVRLHEALRRHARRLGAGAGGGGPRHLLWQVDGAWDWQVGMHYFAAVAPDVTISYATKKSFLGIRPHWNARWVPGSRSPGYHDRGRGSVLRLKTMIVKKADVISDQLRLTLKPNATRKVGGGGGGPVPLRLPLPLPLPPSPGTDDAAEELVLLGEGAQAALERTTLMWVETAVRWIVHRQLPLDRALLRSLARILVQDLARGEPGREARFRWYVGLVAEHFGAAEAKATAMAIAEWRDENFNLNRR